MYICMSLCGSMHVCAGSCRGQKRELSNRTELRNVLLVLNHFSSPHCLYCLKRRSFICKLLHFKNSLINVSMCIGQRTSLRLVFFFHPVELGTLLFLTCYIFRLTSRRIGLQIHANTSGFLCGWVL